ncbi:MAG: helix-turn-helix domain-containing protein [Chloroflexota bacterium]
MASLDELRAALLPGARVVGEGSGGRDGGEAATPEIGWVRVMKARVPAFDALEAGDIAIVPGAALRLVAPGAAERDSLVAACSRARVGAVVLLDSDESETGDRDALDALEAALRVAGLPALRTERADAAALERSIIGFLVNQRAELEHQAAVLEGRLEALALAGTDLDGLVGAVAGFLGRAVALEGPRGSSLAVHAPPGARDAAAAVARYHAQPRAVALRVSLPGSSGPAGSLALLGERPASELERVVSGRIAGLMALELARGDAVRRALDTSRRAETLPAAGPPWVVLVARQRTPEGDTVEARERTRRDLRLLAPARRMGLRGDADSLELRAVLAVDPADPQALVPAGRVAALLGRSVALSRPFEEATGRPAAEAEARATLEAVEPLEEPPAVARADRLPAYRLLGNLHNLPDGARLARSLLEPLLGGRPDVQREHLATLRAVLEQPGLAEAAHVLGVHRNTVAYRVRRIEALTGWRLSDPELRLPLALALRLVQTGQV